MEMIILNEEDLQELESIIERHVGLNRAIKPIKIAEGEYAVNCDILDDKITWDNWIEFLQDKPRKKVDLSEDN